MPKPAKWGRTETIIWPPRSPIYTYGAIFLACIAAGLFLYLRFSFALTPLQQFYLPYYLRTEIAGVMHKTDKYQLLGVADARGRVHLAGDNEVQAGRTIVSRRQAPGPGTHARGAGRGRRKSSTGLRPLSMATSRCTNT